MEALFAVEPDTSNVIDWDTALCAVCGAEAGDADLDDGFLVEVLAEFCQSAIEKLRALLTAAQLFRTGVYMMEYQKETQYVEEVRWTPLNPPQPGTTVDVLCVRADRGSVSRGCAPSRATCRPSRLLAPPLVRGSGYSGRGARHQGLRGVVTAEGTG